MPPDLQTLWAITKTVIGALGGFAGLTKIMEWIFSGPKLVGEVRQLIVGNVERSGTRIGTHVMMHMYLVNKRINPISLKAFAVFAKLDGKWTQGEM